MHLLLFDIDGTLVRVNGTGRTAVTDALSSVTGRPVSTDGITFSGRTDPAIIEAVLEKNGVASTQDTVEEAIAAYVDAMKSTLTASDVEVLPGVQALVSALHDHSDVHLGLVTGNVEPIAYEKLAVQDLDHYFPVGAFGSDHADRNQLPELATRRAADRTGRTLSSAEHAVVIGDTAHDIECARAAGARAVAVCTGRYDRTELKPHEPDLLLDSLPSLETFLQQLPGIVTKTETT